MLNNIHLTTNESAPAPAGIAARPLPPSMIPARHPGDGKPKGTIRLLVADDHPVVRTGITACLSREKRIVVVGEAADGREAIQKARELLPDVVILDMEMPIMNGLSAAEALRKELPQVRVLILSMHSNAEFVSRIVHSGAQGYVLKEAVPAELLSAIEKVHAGEAFFSPDVARMALNQYVRGAGENAEGRRITARECEVLVAIAEGLSNKEIAMRLNVGVRTVETHRERIMRKLNIHSVAGLTRYAISKGYVALQKKPQFR